MKDDLRKKFWKIAEENSTKEETHGLDHIFRMIRGFNLFRVENSNRAGKISEDVMDAIEAAIITHDIGLKERRENHADLSVKILRELVAKGELDIPNLGWVLYGISRHSKGLKLSKNPGPHQICGVMVSFFDHLEAIGPIGIYRSIRFCPDKTIFPGGQFDRNDFDRKVRICMINPEGADVEKREMLDFKNSSVLGCLAFNHAICFKVIARAERFICGSKTEKEYLNRQKILFDFTVDLWKETMETG